MMTEPQTIESTGEDVEAAIANGLAQLGLSRQQATIEILDEGSKGILGIGKREAIVRIQANVTMPVSSPTSLPATSASENAPLASDAEAAIIDEPSALVDELLSSVTGMPTLTPSAEEKEQIEGVAEVKDAGEESAGEIDDQESLEEEIKAARQVLETLLDKLQIDADIQSRTTAPDEKTGRRIGIFNIEGRDLSLLIGPQGKTLNSLQYLTRLMTAHVIKRRSYIIVDVANYRERRKQALAKLADRMASKAIKRNRPVTLEPMPAAERRAIHIALRHNDAVTTQSVGEGRGRRVRISLK